MALMLLARVPMTAMGMTLALHVVADLGHGYGAAGLVGTATTLGTAIGAPVVGRMIDRYGLRPVVAVCGTACTAFWLSTPYLPCPTKSFSWSHCRPGC
jgi:MFS family permease